MDDVNNGLQLWNIVITAGGIVGAAMWIWLVFFVKREVKKWDDLSNAFTQHRIDLVSNYSTKIELRESHTRLEKRIDDGFSKIDTKLDLVFERIDKKQDKL